MKKSIINIILCMIIMLSVAGCANINNSINDTNNNQKANAEEKENIVEYYKYDESINLFINKYNNKNTPSITSDMITKKHIGGRDRDNIATIFNEKLEIILYGSNKSNELYSMSVYIGYKPNVDSTNDDFKEQFIKYIKVLDDSLTDDDINNYWSDMIAEYRSGYKINKIDITPNVINGKLEYFKMTAKIKL
jgi:hypothetical protein